MNNMRNWSVTVALSGFLFGFDTVVISGANLPIRELWDTSAWFHGMFIMSMALWGTVVGALCGGIPCNRFGRKKTLFWIGVLYLISALGSGLAPDPYSFSFFRFIGGLGVGASSVAAPTYISEISSAKNRGKLVALYQFNLVFGILLAYISNYLLQGVGGVNDWRFMLGVEAIPAVIYSIMVLGVPNSPRWLLLHKQDEAGAREVLHKMYDGETAEKALEQIRLDNSPEKGGHVFSRKFGLPLLLAFLIAFFNQLSGINFILYYAPEILEMAGLASKDSLMNAISIGVINLIFTLLGLRLIDNLGRKQLMLIGSAGYIISLAMVAWSFYASANPVILLIFILLFIASHAIGQGAVIWVFISEIFPNRVRAYGQAFGSGVHWVFAALITLLAPVFIDMFRDNPWPIFAFFAFMMVLQLLFTLFLMPETKGVSLEELEKRMVKDK
ncbi:MFS transporter, sugar porter (SP) family [Sinomicrobium oceani]|uniref:MFS transporter, sugar porter (SP) family n=1 Tax=Sinomicrobium oceani TaxID=1150368 RepID=A0A1K1MSZ1_9FLAO|nr:sugar porter family MFS transporter [Sinomicrobium oceani]SFW26201.1 MFS transporter, sugar porter (SP) family [Sinomicrobium oceani]